MLHDTLKLTKQCMVIYMFCSFPFRETVNSVDLEQTPKKETRYIRYIDKMFTTSIKKNAKERRLFVFVNKYSVMKKKFFIQCIFMILEKQELQYLLNASVEQFSSELYSLKFSLFCITLKSIKVWQQFFVFNKIHFCMPR